MPPLTNIIHYPAGLRVGFEIEFCSVMSNRTVEHDLPPEVRAEYVVGTDQSLQPTMASDVHQLEIRSRWPSSHVDVDILRRLLTCVKVVNDQAPKTRKVNNQCRAFTTRRCGLHIHASWTYIEKAQALAQLVDEKIVKRYTPFPERASFCDPGYSSHRGSRYNAIRHVDTNHFEIRIFNGTLKLRGIAHWLRVLSNLAQQVEAMDAQALSIATRYGWPGSSTADEIAALRDFVQNRRRTQIFDRWTDTSPEARTSSRFTTSSDPVTVRLSSNTATTATYDSPAVTVYQLTQTDFT